MPLAPLSLRTFREALEDPYEPELLNLFSGSEREGNRGALGIPHEASPG